MKNKLLSKKFIVLIAIIVIVLLFILWKYEVWKFISIEYLKEYTGRIRRLGVVGIVLYLLGFTLATMLCMPSLPFALLGGITYGTKMGIIYASIGDLLGASAAFIIARYIMRDRIEKKLKNNKTFHEINEGVQNDGWRIVALSRMVPVIPHWLQNYAYGLTEISFKVYVLVTLLSIIPGTAAWIIAVNTVGKNREDAKLTMMYLAIATIVIVGISYLPKYIYKKKLSKK